MWTQKQKFFYDMEYINGKTLSLILISRPFIETVNIIDNIFKFIFFVEINLIMFIKKIFFF